MKRSNFSNERFIAILREQEVGVPVANLCKKHGLSSPTFYKWKAKFGGMEVSEAKRLKAVEDENAKPKRMMANAMLDNVCAEGSAGKVVTPAAHQEAAAHLRSTDEMGERACRVLGVDRTSVRFQARRTPDTELRERLRTLAQERRRFGYRRL
jgi:putative transposase